ncbi:DUF2786 domain-containing protein [Kribbella sp. ALI-6-A]|uniref:DUF2786 domain-containing protein n=1 Tax=Kribbella sp. ALI-6-A TaxID=1933817 RepID=UPI001EDB9624|nr:DUF2786 domain-containing protein [Kribbella sp. ALI-6-A]
MSEAEVLRVLQLVTIAADPEHQLAELGRYDEQDQQLVDRVIRQFLIELMRKTWERGWAPADVVQNARRQLEPGAEPLLLAVIAAEHRAYKPKTLDARWSDQLAELGLEPPYADLDLTAWSAEHRLGRYLALHRVASLAWFLFHLPALARLFPLPGTARPTPKSATQRTDQATDRKMLARVRALLAKAEATEFPDEAEALSGKAQELMAKFSLDHALLDAGPELDLPDDSGARRIWVETPYVTAKAQLVGVVAHANGCRTVTMDELAVVTIVGSELDLQLTELLATSLLVQANRAMLAAGKHFGRRGESRTRSFRQSFLIAYAQRIGERLQATADAARSAVPEADQDRLLPVLSRREQQVDALFTKLFPETVTRRTRITNGAGWHAGLTAADLAQLDTHRPVTR